MTIKSARLPSAARRGIRILSFDPDVLRQVNTLAPQLKCVINTDGTGSWCVPAADLLSGRFGLEFLNAVCLEQKKLSTQVVDWAHHREMGVLTYSCNTRSQVERALALGVDGIMSDQPGRLVALFRHGG